VSEPASVIPVDVAPMNAVIVGLIFAVPLKKSIIGGIAHVPQAQAALVKKVRLLVESAATLSCHATRSAVSMLENDAFLDSLCSAR